jgi:hypothetical protein
MSERERWIVYPLVFFALGAALRDKFTQQVKTDSLHAGQITCEKLLVMDSEKPDRPVAILTSNQPQRGSSNPNRFGVLVLFDSQGRELFGVANNILQVKDIACQTVQSEQVKVVDPLNPRQVLALMTAATMTASDKSSLRLGSLLLADSEGRQNFTLVNDQLKMRQIICEGVAVVDPDNSAKILAALGSIAPETKPGEKSQRFGVLALNNQEFGTLTGNPPPAVRQRKSGDQPGSRPETSEDGTGEAAPDESSPPPAELEEEQPSDEKRTEDAEAGG